MTPIVVVGAGGGEGSSTITALLVLLLAQRDGAQPQVVGRPDDDAAARLSEEDGSAVGAVLIDVGPHAADETLLVESVLVTVCAATTGSIERARARIRDADARGLTTAALVICARTLPEERRGHVRMQQASMMDARIVALPFDPALAPGGRIDLTRLSPATVEAGRRLLSLLPAR